MNFFVARSSESNAASRYAFVPENADDVPGAVKSSEIQPPRAMRWFGRGLRRPPQ